MTPTPDLSDLNRDLTLLRSHMRLLNYYTTSFD